MIENDEIIFNLNQLPFCDFDSAARLRDLLHQESGHHYQVEKYIDESDHSDESDENEIEDSFVIIRKSRAVDSIAIPVENENSDQAADDRPTAPDQENITDAVREVYHPAMRVFLLYIPLSVVGLVFFLIPQDTWVLIFSAFEIRSLPGFIDAALLIKVSQMVGLAILVYNVFCPLYAYFSITLIIDNRGVALKKGIIAQDIINLRFSEIKTIGLKRSITDRFLRIGTLEFASSGSDGIDIRFFNIHDPAGVKENIENLIEQYK